MIPERNKISRLASSYVISLCLPFYTVILLSFIIFTGKAFGSGNIVVPEELFSECRNSKAEGWAWGHHSIEYLVDKDVTVSFSDIHTKLRRSHYFLTKAAKDTSTNCNICIAQLNIVIVPKSGIGNPILFVPQKHPMEPLVFVSGSEEPSFNGMQSQTLEPKPRNDGVKPSLEIERRIVSQYIIDELSKPYFEGLRFIHPRSDYFLLLPDIIRRLNDRYRNANLSPMFIRAKLAKEWLAINSLDDQVPQDEINRQKIAWYRGASAPSSFHKGLILDMGLTQTRKKECLSNGIDYDAHSVFFEPNADSEQKLFYFFYTISECVEGFILLKEILKKVEAYANANYCLALINGLMRYCNSQTALIRDEITKKKLIDGGPTQRDIEEDFRLLDEYCANENLRRRQHFNNFYLDMLKQAKEKVRDNFVALAALDPKAPIEDNKFKNGSKSEADRQTKLLKVLNVYLPIGENPEKPLVDSTMEQYLHLLEKCKEEKPDYAVFAVILNVHSTNDICFSCAPDLAEESWRDDGFMRCFTGLASKKIPGPKEPFFRTIYSCGRIRDTKRCTKCIRPKRQKEVWLKPPGKHIAFYQHHFPLKKNPDDEDEVTFNLKNDTSMPIAIPVKDQVQDSGQAADISQPLAPQELQASLLEEGDLQDDILRSRDDTNSISVLVQEKVPEVISLESTKQRIRPKREPIDPNEKKTSKKK